MEFFQKISTAVLLAIYMVSAPATAELLKLPLLLHHYAQHKAGNKNTSVLSFFTAHYNTATEQENNSMEDQQLPFKSPHQDLAQSFVVLPAVAFVASIIKTDGYINPAFSIPDHLKLPAQYLAVICHPPPNC